MKPIEDSFSDWESSAFGFGYGSGEEHIVAALRIFFSQCEGEQGSYDYQGLEQAMTPTAAWLMINRLCQQDIIEYGTSPRYGWLTPHGRRLRDFIRSKTNEDLVALSCRDTDYSVCYPDACNCGPDGYEAGRVCANPFWPDNRGLMR